VPGEDRPASNVIGRNDSFKMDWFPDHENRKLTDEDLKVVLIASDKFQTSYLVLLPINHDNQVYQRVGLVIYYSPNTQIPFFQFEMFGSTILKRYNNESWKGVRNTESLPSSTCTTSVELEIPVIFKS
jgi:hypothetical protein